LPEAAKAIARDGACDPDGQETQSDRKRFRSRSLGRHAEGRAGHYRRACIRQSSSSVDSVASSSVAASAITVPGPKTAAAPISRSF
jgi:hypothetical protein